MRLVNIGPGEIADRLTILALKILHGGTAGKPIDHFERERNALLTQIRSREQLNGKWLEHFLELGAINAALWQKEDEMRAWRRADRIEPAQVVNLAFRIQELNDRRAELVQQINVNTGDHLGAEKV